MATETELTIITLNNLDRAIKKMERIFAPISIEDEAINAVISKEQPENQSVGDLWFVETERN